MPHRKQYRRPPLVEVFCEFFFEGPEGTEWDSFGVPSFYKKIKSDFPTRKRLASVGVEFKVAGNGAAPEVKTVGPPTPRHQFVSENGKTLVQLGENLLVVNQLPPYYGWERFEPTVAECLKTYVGIWKPKTVARAAVHYIDKVDIPKPEVRIEQYLNLYPNLPEFPGTTATNLAMAYEVGGASEGDILAVTMRQHPSANPEGVSFMFQWDYVATVGMPATSSAVGSWLKGAHGFLSQVFLSTFTEDCLKLFDPEDG
jgi:uncharacterized protein (TIGR04255 family)